MNTPTERTYAVGDGPVVVQVTVLGGQKGRIAIQLNGQLVAEGMGRVRENLGSGLAGATVEIFTVVNHTASTTPFFVEYQWSGGPSPQTDEDRGDFQTDPDPSFVEPIYRLVSAEGPNA